MKTIVQKPVVDPLGARFYCGNLMYQRGCISTDIQMGVISILMKGHQVGFTRTYSKIATGANYFERLSCKSKVQVFDTPQVSTVLRSNLMRLYFPVDLTGNLIMIEKLVSGGT